MVESVGAQAVETVEDIGTKPAEVVRRWLLELEEEDKVFKKWRRAGDKVVKRYRDDARRTGSQYNILWSNTETLKPALLSATPKPDVRRRYRDKDPAGRYASQALERTLEFQNDTPDEGEDSTSVYEQLVADYLLPGRAVLRYDYEPETAGADEDEAIVWETVSETYVDWRDFRHDPAPRWSDTRWIAYRHQMTRDELVDNFGEKIGKEVTLVDHLTEDRRQLLGDAGQGEFFKTAEVWEVWDKTEKQRIFVARGMPDRPLATLPDRLGLRGFFNTPKPLVSVQSNDTQVPVPEFTLYQDQARELDRTTARIDRLVDACRFRGVYNSTMEAFGRLMNAPDNKLLPETAWDEVFADGKRLESNVMFMPIEQIANVLVVLQNHRVELLNIIFQITGISDLMRGATSPNETATAQRLKGQFGAFRLQPRQQAVQRYIRDGFRLKAEIIAEKFQPASIVQQSQLDLPTVQEKMQAFVQAQAFQDMGKEVPEQIQLLLNKPTWQDVIGLMRSDMQRSFRIDVETDSTVAPDSAQEKADVVEFLGAAGTYITNIAPLVQVGVVPIPLAAGILQWASRRYKISREIEDQLALAVDEQEQSGLLNQPQAEGPDPAMLAQQQQAQAEGQQAQLELQVKAQGDQADREAKLASSQAENESKERIAAAQIQAENERFVAKLQAEAQIKGVELQETRVIEQLRLTGDEKGFNVRQHVDAQEVEVKELAAVLGQLVEQMAQQNQQNQQLLAVIAQGVTAPKRLIRDGQGRAVGVEVVNGAAEGQTLQ